MQVDFGQPDPSDPTHFTFTYEVNKHRSVIDGRLRKGDRVDLWARGPTATELAKRRSGI